MARRDPEPRLLTQGQAAAYCGVCCEVFKKACPVPPIKVADRIPRYDRHALDRWIDSLDNRLPTAPVDEGNDLRALWNASQHDARSGH